ncbi:formate dehydrogenase subunit gamma [Phaeovulum sp.]|uniref:formate dehydrogenase subunit gamma n=1 Tax=Phaeovulum sp. TaxID=2934796 RepID=UPI0039E54848
MTTDSNIPTRRRVIHDGNPVMVDRYSGLARLNHWVTAAGLILLALSGLALFHPSLYFLTGLFGGGTFARFIHPWIGVVTFVSFAGLFLRFWRLNLWSKADSRWLGSPGAVLSGDEEALPEVGKYNAGQKVYFWVMSILILILFLTGSVIWMEYFAAYFTIEQRRIAVLIHSISAIGAICAWIVHVYAAIWVRGTLNAMTRGQVTGGWAWRHHRKWLRDLVSGNPNKR